MKGPRPDFLREKWVEIGERIGRAAQARQVQLSDLADQLDVSPALISKWIYGRGCPNSDFLDRIAHALTVSRQYLLGENDASAVEVDLLLDQHLRAIQRHKYEKHEEKRRLASEARAAKLQAWEGAEQERRAQKSAREAERAAVQQRFPTKQAMAAVRGWCVYCKRNPRMLGSRFCNVCNSPAD